MASRPQTTSSRSKRSRALLITLSTVAISAIAAGGIWWGLSASSNASPSGSASPAAALPDETTMGAVELHTDDLESMRAFYVDAVGLEVLEETADRLSLGLDGEELLALALAEGRAVSMPTEAGLFHTAIVYPDKGSLARALMSVATVAPASYSGSADHAVSLAFYFSDPEGNGLELYVDTPRGEWVWEDGFVQMGSAPLEPNAFINDHSSTAPPESLATMGHVHLRVGDLAQAREFYADTLGFAVTAESDGALFYAAGGYHHHVATNIWNSSGAQTRSESLGLGSLTVHVGGATALDEAVERLTQAGVSFTEESGTISVDDPWGNTVRLLA